MEDFGFKVRSGTRRFFAHRVHFPLPIFVLKIGLLIALVALSTVFIVHTVVLRKKLEWQPPPLILVPGVMGSKLYVEGIDLKYDDAPDLRAKCKPNVPLRKSWVSDQLQKEPHCELYFLSLTYDEKRGKFANQPGVDISANLRGIPFGSSLWPVQCTSTDENPLYCDISTFKGFDENYFRRFAGFLTSRLKYQPGITLLAAQYDWRHHQESDVMNEYYDNLKFLVEHTFNTTHRKVLLLGHSMGNIVINRFLRDKVTPEWQKQHIEATINVAAPYGGSSKTIKSLLSGEPTLNDSISAQQMVNFVRKMGFPANLLPFKNAFGNEVLVHMGKDAYSAEKMGKFLRDVDTKNLAKFYANNEPVPQPHILMHCIYSVGANNTDYKYVYASITDSEPKIEMGDGDGTVNAESLRVCQQWKAQGHKVTIKEFADMKHTEILMENDFYAYIADLLISF